MQTIAFIIFGAFVAGSVFFVATALRAILRKRQPRGLGGVLAVGLIGPLSVLLGAATYQARMSSLMVRTLLVAALGLLVGVVLFIRSLRTSRSNR